MNKNSLKYQSKLHLDFIAVEIEKIKEREDAFVKNNIPTGYKVIRTELLMNFNPPTLNERFTVGTFSSSPVQEIINNHTFKTWNSIYTWKIIDEPNIMILTNEQKLLKQKTDCLNYAKSELAKIEKPKLDKTSTPYSRAVTHILNKVIKILEK